MAIEFRPMPDARVYAQRMVRPDVDFVVTTCVSGFVPMHTYQQAGLIVYDGHGSAPSGRFTVNTTTANGGSIQGTFTGTYIVNGDCTGTLQIDLGDGTLFHFDLVVQGSAKHTAINTDSGTFMSVFSIEKIRGENDTAEAK